MSETGYCYARREPADRQALAKIVRRFCPPPAYLLQERMDKLVLGKLEPDWLSRAAADSSAVWPEGRAFGSQCEVHWLQAGEDAYQVTLLTEKPPKDGPGEEWQSPQEYDEVAKRRAFLWGEWDEKTPGYWQTNIPRLLHWPVSGRRGVPYAALETVEYRRDGITLLTRLRGVVTTNQRGEVA